MHYGMISTLNFQHKLSLKHVHVHKIEVIHEIIFKHFIESFVEVSLCHTFGRQYVIGIYYTTVGNHDPLPTWFYRCVY